MFLSLYGVSLHGRTEVRFTTWSTQHGDCTKPCAHTWQVDAVRLQLEAIEARLLAAEAARDAVAAELATVSAQLSAGRLAAAARSVAAASPSVLSAGVARQAAASGAHAASDPFAGEQDMSELLSRQAAATAVQGQNSAVQSSDLRSLSAPAAPGSGSGSIISRKPTESGSVTCPSSPMQQQPSLDWTDALFSSDMFDTIPVGNPSSSACCELTYCDGTFPHTGRGNPCSPSVSTVTQHSVSEPLVDGCALKPMMTPPASHHVPLGGTALPVQLRANSSSICLTPSGSQGMHPTRMQQEPLPAASTSCSGAVHAGGGLTCYLAAARVGALVTSTPRGTPLAAPVHCSVVSTGVPLPREHLLQEQAQAQASLLSLNLPWVTSP